MLEKKIRAEILKYYYESYKKNPDEHERPSGNFIKKIGIKPLDLYWHFKYLTDMGFLKCMWLSNHNYLCKITVDGINAYENPDMFSSKAPFLNVVKIEGDMNAPIYQTKEFKMEIEFNNIYQVIDTLDLKPQEKDELHEKVDELKNEIDKDNPDNGKIRTLIKFIKSKSILIYNIANPLIVEIIKQKLGIGS